MRGSGRDNFLLPRELLFFLFCTLFMLCSVLTNFFFVRSFTHQNLSIFRSFVQHSTRGACLRLFLFRLLSNPIFFPSPPERHKNNSVSKSSAFCVRTLLALHHREGRERERERNSVRNSSPLFPRIIAKPVQQNKKEIERLRELWYPIRREFKEQNKKKR